MNHLSSPGKERIGGPELYSVSTRLGLMYVERLVLGFFCFQVVSSKEAPTYSYTLNPWFTLTDLFICLPKSSSPRLSFSVENCP